MNMWCAQTKKPKTRDGDRGERDGGISEDALAAEGGDDLGDHAHARQNHDVDGGVRVEPEEMLEEERIAALGGIEDADADDALESDQDEGDGQNRGAEHHEDAGGVVRPDEERQAEPGHARGAHRWMVTMKFRPVKMEQNPAMKMPSPAVTTLVFR